MRKILLFLFLIIIHFQGVSQSSKEKAKTFVDNLVKANGELFAYTKGNFAVSDNGAMNYEVPIGCVPGAAGMTPKLSLVYNSNNGSGILGEGWSLSGLSVITRTNQNRAIDGINGIIEFNDNDRLQLDGQRLIKKENSTVNYWASSANRRVKYYTEQNTFKEITAYYWNDNVYRLEVRTKDGLIYHFGAIDDGEEYVTKGRYLKASGTSQIISWLLVRIEDLNQNTIDFEYDSKALEKSFIKPTLISYTGRKTIPNTFFAFVKLSYKKIKAQYKYINGEKIQFDEMVETITSEYKDPANGVSTDARVYKIITEESRNKFYLKEVEECVSPNNCVKTKFSWQTYSKTAVLSESSAQLLDTTLTEDYDVHPGDFNGDGLLDNAFIKVAPDKVHLIFSRNIKGKFDKGKAYELTGSFEKDCRIIVNDFDDNGTSDFAFCWIRDNQVTIRIVYNTAVLNGRAIEPPKLGPQITQQLTDNGINKNELFFSTNDFNGDGLQDLYWYYYKDYFVKNCYAINNVNGQFTVATKQPLSIIFPNGSTNDTIPNHLPINFGDYNSDGISDMLFTWINSNGWNTKIFLLEKNFELKSKPVTAINQEHAVSNAITVLQLDRSQSNITIDSTQYELDSLIGIKQSHFNLFKNENLPITKAVYSLDLNHDGNTDLLVSNQNASGWKIWSMIGKGNGQFEEPKLEEIDKANYKYSHSQSFGDFNGDGQIDVCITLTTDTGWHTKITYGMGSGAFSKNPDWIKLRSGDFSYSIKQQIKGMLNLEGFVQSYPEVSAARLKTLNRNVDAPADILNNLDKAATFFANKIWLYQIIPTAHYATAETEYFNNFTYKDKPKEFGDDFSNMKRLQSISLFPQSNKISIQRNKIFDITSSGDPRLYEEKENKELNEYAIVQFIDYWKPIVADLDGDGITDFALTYPRQPQSNVADNGNGLNGECKVFTVINKAIRSGKIERVEFGNGAVIRVAYANTTELGSFDSNSLPVVYPNIPYNIPMNVVTSTKSPNGIGGENVVNYEFKNGIIGITGRGFMGFEKVTTEALTTNNLTRKTALIDNQFLNRGLFPLKSIETRIQSKKVNEENFENQLFTTEDNQSFFNFIKQKASTTFDLTGAVLSTNTSYYEYDHYGNLTKTTTKYDDGQVDEVSNDYFETSKDESDAGIKEDNLKRWIIGRLKSTLVYKSKGTEEVKRKSEFDYYVANEENPAQPVTGQLKTEKSLVGTIYEIHKQYSYDDRGNKVSEKSYPKNKPLEAVETKFEFDPIYHKRFLTQKIDAENYIVKYVPQVVYGFNITTEDADGNKDKLDFPTNYDVFGKTKKTIAPDGNWNTEKTYKCQSCGVANAIYFTVSSSSTFETPVISYFDILDRVIRQVSFNQNFKRIVKEDFYNAKGQIRKTNLPYFDDNASPPTIYSSTMEYDILGRLLIATNPDGTKNKIVYSGLTTTAFNAKEQKNTVTYNQRGWKISEADNLGNEIKYTYDLDGNKTKITDQTNREFVTLFDKDLGKVIYSRNPNMGHAMSYSYNAWGEIESVKCGYKGQIETRFSYDKIGRIKTRTDNKKNIAENAPENKIEDKVEYSYVLAVDQVNGKGKLKSIKVTGDDRKLGKTFDYDRYGRLVKKEFLFENYVGGNHNDEDAKDFWNSIVGSGKSLSVRYAYNSLGQLDSMYYPRLKAAHYNKDFIVHYTYINGFVKQVIANAKKIWEHIEGDANGQATTVALNEGATTTDYRYNTKNQNLEEITTLYKKTTKVQKWSYEYDNLNQITQRLDLYNSPNFAEFYSYDNLNRIASVQMGNTKYDYRYDVLGNIVYRSDVGYYRDRNVFDYTPGESNQKERKLIINRDSLETFKNDEGKSFDNDEIEYYYDLVGNRYKKELKEKAQFTINYNHFNKPRVITNHISEDQTTYFYDENNSLQIESNDKTIKYFIDGLLEFEKSSSSEKAIQKYFITVNSSVIAYNLVDKNTTGSKERYYFFHKDALGSITAITNESGKATILAYDIWGKRLDASTWNTAKSGFSRGYTGHQHWDELALINMGGRIFDPVIGQFLQVDPILNLEIPSLGLTAYGYGYNNPLFYTDPTGYWFGKKIGQGVSNFFKDVGRGIVRGLIAAPILGSGSMIFANMPGVNDFIDKNAGTIVMIETSIAMMAIGAPPVAAGFATGFSSSFAQTYLNGGSFGQSLEMGLQSGAISAVTAGITAGIGDLFMGPAGSTSGGLFGNEAANYAGKAVTHAAFQGAMNEAQGGNFWDGALPALISSASDPLIGQVGGYDVSSRIGRTAIAATIGGTTSVIGGGKFANGAITAAVVHMYNFEAHHVDIGSGGSGYRSDKDWESIDPPIEPTLSPIDFIVGGATWAATRAYATGAEFFLGAARIAPFGNRSGHPIGRYPHYHRRGMNPQTGETLPGQSIKRHRPWETKSTDKSLLDRF